MSESYGHYLVMWKNDGEWYQGIVSYERDIPQSNDIGSETYQLLVDYASRQRQLIIDGEAPISSDPPASIEECHEQYDALKAYTDRLESEHRPWIERHVVFLRLPDHSLEELASISRVIAGIS